MTTTLPAGRKDHRPGNTHSMARSAQSTASHWKRVLQPITPWKCNYSARRSTYQRKVFRFSGQQDHDDSCYKASDSKFCVYASVELVPSDAVAKVGCEGSVAERRASREEFRPAGHQSRRPPRLIDKVPMNQNLIAPPRQAPARLMKYRRVEHLLHLPLAGSWEVNQSGESANRTCVLSSTLFRRVKVPLTLK